MTREEILSIAYSIGTVGEPWWLDDDDLMDFVRAIAPRLESAARADEREQAARVCDAHAMRTEKAAQDCIESGEHDEVNALRSTAWKISVCAAAIRAMKEQT